MSEPKSAYARAGVDIDEMMTGLDAVKRMVKGTAVRGVVGGLGAFGGLFASPGRANLLVASMDGVGTKLKVAALAGRHKTVGQDLVNHCVNDILVQGATPLFFMDYLGTARLSAAVFRDVLEGLCRACRRNGCALLGGETAEMPGLYPSGEYDLVGTIVGTVPRGKLITGERIRPGDRVIGLPSTGLHTNGFSLARKIVFEQAGLELGDRLPGTGQSVADALLAVHRSYLKPVRRVMERVAIRGMAHITGGGLYDNIPRILPDGALAVLHKGRWRVPPVFQFLRERGGVDEREMHRVFNMGVGYVIVVRARDVEAALQALKEARSGAVEIGVIESGAKGVTLTA